jgi:hypothetical protein
MTIVQHRRAKAAFETEMGHLVPGAGGYAEHDRPSELAGTPRRIRSCPLHWTAYRTQETTCRENIAKALDAEELLEKAGIPTAWSRAWAAQEESPDALKAFSSDRYGTLSPDDLGLFEDIAVAA